VSPRRQTNYDLPEQRARVKRVLWAIGVCLLVASLAEGQEPPTEIPPVDREPYSANGFLELRPVMIWQDMDAALFRLRSFTDTTPDARTTQLNSRLQLDAAYRRGWFSAQTRAVVDGAYATGNWTGDATAYEAFLSVKPAPSLTVDAGKKTLKWGKGYIWNPAAFLDRVKSPEDPALALEGFTVLSADYIRTFEGPLQVMSVTPVLLPVFGDLNRSFGERGHLNVAGKLYLLFLDTDIDVMFLTGGSRRARFGMDFSRDLRSNLEVHGEMTHVPNDLSSMLEPADTLAPRERPATSLVLGLRYLTEANTTYIVDYFRNGAGYTPGEMEAYFEFIGRGYESWTVSGDQRVLTLASRATETGYGRMNPMRNYVYGRVNQPDALGVLYLTLGGSVIVNVDDGSYSLLPEVQYKATENLELRWLANIQRGGSRTEFGEKPADVRLELRVRYYF
jgi:hypothetical protein